MQKYKYFTLFIFTIFLVISFTFLGLNLALCESLDLLSNEILSNKVANF